ncbi:MAG: 2-oxoglutarate dehydrogenase E1 component [Bacteroidia bacterium]
MDAFTFISGGDPAALENLYEQYKGNPESVDESWVRFFEGVDFATKNYPGKVNSSSNGNSVVSDNISTEFKVINLINGYRSRGHLFTRTNPVRERRHYTPSLEHEHFNLNDSDLDTVFQAGELIGIGPATLRKIIAHLQETYCESVGIEYMYMRNLEAVSWLQTRMESSRGRAKYSAAQKQKLFQKLSEAVGFESFLDKKFVGQKRFSLEGCEALIPAMDLMISHGEDLGIQEFVIGMAHRGRLNVLANIFQKDPVRIFTEFEGKEYEDNDDGEFSGDVKYHLGYSTEVKSEKGAKMQLTLSPNPSHLEAVGPVVEGMTRAFAEQNHESDYRKITPVVIHGDAAIAGQGVVYEVVQMAKLDGYKTGGTIHIVVNNQVGFTTNYLDGRSSIYCTDVAKVTLSPVFHVNADDVEAVAFVVQMAMEFRQKFQGDVFIDLLGYRKYGHNEGDEPRFTQPILYKQIAKHPNPRKIYFQKLASENVISQEQADKFEKAQKENLEKSLAVARDKNSSEIKSFLEMRWKHIRRSKKDDFHESPETGVDAKILRDIAQTLYTIPKGMKFFKKMEKVLADRKKMIEETNQLDWGMAEQLSYGSLLLEGHPVRFSGQDVERGTFSHRHAVLKIEDSEEEYEPLNNLDKKQAPFRIYNSLLSEYAVLGFDYGYSLAVPDGLTIWEAQFGDFNNGAQIIIDQFISSAEDKWRSMSNLVMLLPHGYEGQGAEHSSGRMERFLQLCAEHNMIVANVTTPANYFHIIRRQIHHEIRKPLIIFSPKSLLRLPACVSTLEDLATGKFKETFDDVQVKAGQVNKLIFCSGKIYYDLLEERESRGISDTAIIRIEQLYPFPQKQVDALLKKYTKSKRVLWVQEEPANMGAWMHVMRMMRNCDIELVSRAESGSPATGSSKRHAMEQKQIMEKAFSK